MSGGKDIEQIKKDLDNLSVEDKKKLAATAVKTTKELNEMSLTDAIMSLSGAALGADEAFFNIEKNLQNVNTGTPGVSAGLKQAAGQLLSDWKIHRSTFVKLMWKSRSLAGEAESVAKDYAQNILAYLQLDAVTTKKKKDFIDKYVVKLEKQEAGAQELTQGFVDLHKEVGAFQTQWGVVVKREGDRIDEEDKRKVADLNKKIADLKTDLEKKTNDIAELNEKIKQMKKQQADAEEARKGVSGFFKTVVPEFFGGLIGSIFGKGKQENPKIPDVQPLINDQREIEQKLKQANEDITKPNPDRDAVNQLRAGLESSTSGFKSITDRLGAFATVWARIKHDIGQVKNSLKTAGEGDDDDDEPVELWQIRMEKVTEDYKMLQKALSTYSTTVILPPQPSK